MTQIYWKYSSKHNFYFTLILRLFFLQNTSSDLHFFCLLRNRNWSMVGYEEDIESNGDGDG